MEKEKTMKQQAYECTAEIDNAVVVNTAVYDISRYLNEKDMTLQQFYDVVEIIDHYTRHALEIGELEDFYDEYEFEEEEYLDEIIPVIG